jgi:predicted O-linked N-acetylglucosamine transferase (SPINDLY family)
MITYTLSQYEAFAIKLGTHPSSLKSIKEKLQKNKLSENLFNTKLFVKYLESAYEKVHTNHEEGLSPEDLCLNESDKA